MTILNILRKVPIFKDIKDADLKKIEKILKEENFKKDEHIFSENDQGEEFYVVYEGRVKIYKMSMGGQVKALDYLEPGDFFGEMALLDRLTRSANALAVKNSRLFTIKYEDFQEFLVEEPKILITITRTLCQRLRRADQEIEMFSFKNVKDRLVLCLINLAEKYGEETDDGIKVTMNFTHQELSELIGTAREVVTRLLKQLKQEGLVKSLDQHLAIPSVAELRKKISE